MDYNPNAQIFESQIVIDNTQPVGATTGSIVNKGSLSTQDTFITGHGIINNVKITPNLNDIIFEQQATLDNNQNTFKDIENFYFDDSVCNSFKAIVNVTVSDTQATHAVWEINGLYKPSGWVITSSFTGDLTGVLFSIENKQGGIGQLQYTNSNTSGTTVIRFRATTTAPPGSTPLGASTGVINNTSGPFLANNLVYANTADSLASTDIVYNSNVLRIGGASRIVGENGSEFINFSNGGALTSMGDASVAKKIIIGEKVGIATTAPAYALDIVGDINFTGTFYKNNNVYSGSEIWNTNGDNIFYNTGNLGIKTSTPSVTLDVVGNAKISNSISSGSINVSNINSANSSIGSFVAGSGTIGGHLVPSANVTYDLGSGTQRWRDIYLSGNTIHLGDKQLSLSGDTFQMENIAVSSNISAPNAQITTLTAGTIRNTNVVSGAISAGTLDLSTGLTAANINFTGSLYQNGSPYTSSQWTTTAGNIFYTTGNVGIGTETPSHTLDVNGGIRATAVTTTNMVSTSVSAATLALSTGLTSASAQITNANVTTLTAGTLQNTNVVSTNVSSATLSLSTGLTSASAMVTNANVTTLTAGTLQNTNVVSTNTTTARLNTTFITAGYLQVTGSFNSPAIGGTNLSISNITSGDTNLTRATAGRLIIDQSFTAASGFITNANATTMTVGTLRNTDAISTNVSSATLNLSSGLTSASAQITNANVTTLTTGTLRNTNIISTAMSAGTLSLSTGLTSASAQITNVNSTVISAGTLIGTTITGANMSLSGDLIIGGNLTTVNITTTNVVDTNITSGNIYINNLATITNANVTALTSASAQITNANVTTLTTGTLQNTNAISTNVSSATLNLSTGLTSASAQITNANVTTLTAGTLQNTNAISTNVSSATLNLSTGLTSASAQITNANVTTATVPTLLNTNAVSTNVSAATLALSTGLTSASAQITNANVTTLTAGTLRNTNLFSTTMSAATLSLSTGITAPSISLDVGIGAIILRPDVYGTTGNLFRYGGAGARGDTLRFVGITDIERMRIDNGGLVGIGTTAPSSILSVVGAGVGGTIRVAPTSTNAESAIGFYSNTTYSGGVTSGDHWVIGKNSWGVGSYNLGIGCYGANAVMNLTSNGNVIITNTLSSSSLVSTNVSAGTLALSTGLTSASAQITNANVTTLTAGTLTATNLTSTNIVGTNISAGTLALSNVNVATATIPSLLTTNANITAASLCIGNSNQSNFISFSGTTGDTGGNHSYIGERIYGGTEQSELLLFKGNDPSLSVGPDRIRLLAAEIRFDTYTSLLSGTFDGVATSGTARLLLNTVGNLICTGDITAFGSLSDIRLKENVLDINSELALDTVLNLRPVTFDWKKDIFNEEKQGASDVGFIAQEVEQLVPLAVSEYQEINNGNNYKSIKHERLIPYLVGAIHQLKSKIEELEKR